VFLTKKFSTLSNKLRRHGRLRFKHLWMAKMRWCRGREWTAGHGMANCHSKQRWRDGPSRRVYNDKLYLLPEK